jgi:hypothetical protein
MNKAGSYKRDYPSDKEECSDLSHFLTAVKGLRSRWRKLKLPTQSDKTRPYGEEKELWFRGQSNIEFGLVPKIWRKEYNEADEAEMRLEFESVGQQFIKPGITFDRWQWYFLMQHYGAPTRLLDWTSNPLVALYFAVWNERENHAKVDAAVWVIDPWRWNRAHIKDLYGPAVAGWQEASPYLLDLEAAFDSDAPDNNTKKKWPIALEPYHIDDRIAAQGSKFTLFGKEKDMVASPAINNPRGGNRKHAVLDRLRIQRGAVAGILEELNHIGINQRTMFPGLDSLGKYIAWEWLRPGDKAKHGRFRLKDDIEIVPLARTRQSP